MLESFVQKRKKKKKEKKTHTTKNDYVPQLRWLVGMTLLVEEGPMVTLSEEDEFHCAMLESP
jgi:hypothetical protein